jgi:acyl-CoA thioesterase
VVARSWIGQLLLFERDGDTFLAREQSVGAGRIFGGLIAAQGLAAAGATVSEDKLPQSLHAYFVRAGKTDVDVEFEVERTRDGRSFDTRRVTARQNGSVILELLTSFHRPEPGVDWHPPPRPMVDLDDAIAVSAPAELLDRFEIRTPEPSPFGFAGLPYWIRTRRPVEDDAMTRACTLAFMSDLGLMAAARAPDQPLRFGPGLAASLDHTIWFQRPFQPDRWHRFQATPLNSNDSRGLAVGSIADAGGTLIASVAQEALWRS